MICSFPISILIDGPRILLALEIDIEIEIEIYVKYYSTRLQTVIDVLKNAVLKASPIK